MEFAENETRNRGETTGFKSSGGGDGGGGKGSQWGNGASPGKIFIGGLSRETTTAQFLEHFGAYGEITDNVIIKDRNTGLPRGFGFITYADPAVVDQVIEDTHVINGKQVEIKRTIPKGSGGDEEFKTKKIFVGGIPETVTEDELRDFFSKFGEVKEHQIMKDPASGRPRGFGFIMFDNEKPVDDILSRGNKLDMGGVQVEVRKAEPKKPNPPPPKSRSNPRSAYDGGYGGAYGGGSAYGGGARGYGYGGGAYRSGGAYGTRASPYGGYGRSEVGGGYSSAVGPYRGGPSLDYPSPYSRGSGGFGRGYDMGGSYGGDGPSYGGYGGSAVAGEGYGARVGDGYGAGIGGGYGVGGGYESSMSGGYGGASAGRGGSYGGPGSYGAGMGSGRYHPYGR